MNQENTKKIYAGLFFVAVILIGSFFLLKDNKNIKVPVIKDTGVSVEVVKSDEEQIREVFELYRSAILAQDGAKALQTIDTDTVQYYDNLLKLVFYGTKGEVSKNFTDELTVLMVRHIFTKAELVKITNGAQLFKLAVESGLVGNRKNTESISISNVSVAGKTAAVQMAFEGKVVPGVVWRFSKEINEWKLNLVAASDAAGVALKASAKQLSMTEDEFVFYVLTQMTGTRPTGEVWNPVK